MSPASTGTVAGPVTEVASVPGLWNQICNEVEAGSRFAGLMATQRGDRLVLSVHLATAAAITTHETVLAPGAGAYPALTPLLRAADWYEREISDLFGIVPAGHPRLDPLVLPHTAARQVLGSGLFTIPHGPVRSGVMESVEYLIETPGEDITHLNLRVFYKHRGIEKRYEQLPPADGVLLAERTEGVASVAHALAFCHAAEALSGAEVSRPAALTRVLYAELERLAAHLDAAVRLADGAGLAVATARFGLHKERVARLLSEMCGSRFGRGVVVPGGVRALPRLSRPELAARLGTLERQVIADAEALMSTSSFLDRLRGTGPLLPRRAAEHGALGPVGKASGFDDDARAVRPYDAYRWLDPGRLPRRTDGDALARLAVRWDEVLQSFRLLRAAAQQLDADSPDADGPDADGPDADGPDADGTAPDQAAVAIPDGRAVGWAEAPHGEVIYDLTVTGGRIARCRVRCASFHNLALFPEVFAGDILTDFPFIEASFGLPIAGVAR
jgi:formate hydrogenlyase subunit 5